MLEGLIFFGAGLLFGAVLSWLSKRKPTFDGIVHVTGDEDKLTYLLELTDNRWEEVERIRSKKTLLFKVDTSELGPIRE
jgi:hypothetical protein